MRTRNTSEHTAKEQNQRDMLKVQIAVRVLLSLKAIYIPKREREKTAKGTELKDTDKRQNAKFNF